MQVTNHLNNKRTMKEEMLEAIFGTVERLEQKVDELSASTKNAEAGSTPVPVSVDTSKLEEVILSVSAKEEETTEKLLRLRDAICVFKNCAGQTPYNGQHTSEEGCHPHRFEPTSKYVLLFIVGLVLSLVISIWGNLTQWREHQDWEEAELKYRALRMVLPSNDPNIRYVEKNFSVCRDENVIDDVRKRVAVYEDSIRRHHEMVEMAAYKDSLAHRLLYESRKIKSTLVRQK